MQEVFEKIMAILEAQDAKIKALEKQLEAYGGGVDTLIDVAYSQADKNCFNKFSEKHRAKFEPYVGIMDKLEGGDSFRAIFDRSLDMDEQEGYDEELYVEGMLTNIIETINALKEVLPLEAREALEDAEEAVIEAAAEVDSVNTHADIPEPELKDPAPEEWTVEELEKVKPEGRQEYR
jgi:hypothetical protein